MIIRKVLAELVANDELNLYEFGNTESARELKMEIDLVKELEIFHLPEITKLICSDKNLLEQPWGKHYKWVQPIYKDSSLDSIYMNLQMYDHEEILNYSLELLNKIHLQRIEIIFNSLKDKCINDENELRKNDLSINKLDDELNVFENELEILENKYKIIQDESAEKDSLQKKISSKKGNITKKRKKKQELIATNNKIRNTYKDNKKFVENNCDIFEKTLILLNNFDEQLSRNREQVYSMQPILSRAEIVINNLLNGEKLENNFQEIFNDEESCINFLVVLNKLDNKILPISALARLFEEGFIDIEEDPIKSYLFDNIKSVILYLNQLEEKYGKEVINSDEEYEIWLNFVLEYAIKNEALVKVDNTFRMLWNSFSNESELIDLIKKVMDKTNYDQFKVLALLFYNTDGIQRKIIMDYLEQLVFEKRQITLHELISLLAENNVGKDNSCIEFTTKLVSKTEKQLKQAVRRANVAQRANDSKSSDIFSATYRPVEKLEELATNLISNYHHKDLSPIMICRELFNIISELRGGLENLEIYPLGGEISDWTDQVEIEYNPAIHQTDKSNPREMIKLRTLGFRYQDSDGEWVEIPSKVFNYRTFEKNKNIQKKQGVEFHNKGKKNPKKNKNNR